MIVYDLECRAGGHRFEGWFGSSREFADQHARGLITCPVCGDGDVVKAISAPNLSRKGNQVTMDRPAPVATPADVVATPVQAAKPALPPEAIAVLRTIAVMQAHALKTSTWVGDRFADSARAMHYGERDAAPIHGQATPDQAQALIEEGIEIAPLLIPYVPPEERN